MRIRLAAAALLRALLACALLAGIVTTPAWARPPLPADEMTSYTLGAPGPDCVYVLDAGFPSMITSKIHIIDGAKLKLLGQVSAGYLSNFEISPDHRRIYMIDTYFSRGTRGKRTDVVSIFDARTLQVTGEIKIPPKRVLIVPKRDTTGLTSDGRFLLIANMTPATSVSVVDLKEHKFVGEIDTPGCVQVLPVGPRKFASMCADGSLLTVELDDAGRLKARRQSKPFFKPGKDPVFDQPVQVGSRVFFDSYHGMIREVDLSAAKARKVAAWSMLTAADVKAKWRPGGWETIDANGDGSRLYVLMHQGGEWTHKQFGIEVWVLDTAAHKRVARIKLKTPGYSIHVSRAPHPMLFNMVLFPLPSKLETYSADDGKFIGAYEDVGVPYLVYGP
jgi:methylamine dehydrogenase heavy chain